MQQKMVEMSVGFLILLAFGCLFFIAFNASVVADFHGEEKIVISADFANVSGLRVKAPVKLSGVRIGEVVSIGLNKSSYQAHVIMKIRSNSKVPEDSEALVLTEGLLGSKYVGLEPGLSESFLQAGGQIQRTVPAMILENLIGKIMISLSKKD